MKRFRSARLAPSAEWKSPWPSMLEGHGFGEWASRGRHVQDLQFREVWSQHRPLSGQVASRGWIYAELAERTDGLPWVDLGVEAGEGARS